MMIASMATIYIYKYIFKKMTEKINVEIHTTGSLVGATTDNAVARYSSKFVGQNH